MNRITRRLRRGLSDGRPRQSSPYNQASLAEPGQLDVVGAIRRFVRRLALSEGPSDDLLAYLLQSLPPRQQRRLDQAARAMFTARQRSGSLAAADVFDADAALFEDEELLQAFAAAAADQAACAPAVPVTPVTAAPSGGGCELPAAGEAPAAGAAPGDGEELESGPDGLTVWLATSVAERQLVLAKLGELLAAGQTRPDAEGLLGEAFQAGLPPGCWETFVNRILPEPLLPAGRDTGDPRLATLAATFQLAADESEYLVFVYCRQSDRRFERLSSWDDTVQEARAIAAMLDLPPARLRQILADEAPLIRCRLLSPPHRSNSRYQLELADSVTDYLSGFSLTPYYTEAAALGPPRFSLDSFPVAVPERELALAALSPAGAASGRQSGRPRHLIIHGEPGTGKTEFVKALVAASGRPGLRLSMGGHEQSRQDRLLALTTIARSAAQAPGATRPAPVIVIDECDDIINTESAGLFGSLAAGAQQPGKEWLNTFLDDAAVTTIWISNRTAGMHDSLKRRFAVSLCFEATSMAHRLRIWQALCALHGVDSLAADQRVRSLLNAYLPSAADMESALLAVCDTAQAGQLARLEQVLASQRTLRTGRVERPRLEALTEAYDPAAVNADVAPPRLVAAIRDARAAGCGLTLLFHGAPGTGKTELAKYLAAESGASLMVRRASDLLSPWVGVAEQQIAAMFREAERNEQILLLDEADSLLRDRRQAVRSWELTQTNELLTQIENFNGIFLACTNLLATLDQAVLRRFAWKVRFLPATPAQCVSLFRRWFPALPADAATRQRLQAIAGLSPGDFKAVERRCRFGGPPLLDEVLQALAEECRLRQDPSGRQPRIGFQ